MCYHYHKFDTLRFDSIKLSNGRDAKRKARGNGIANLSLTKTNGELDQFVYRASHDLRSPLTSILGLIIIAKRSENPREIVRCLDMIGSRVNRLDDLIKDIVSNSRNSRMNIGKQLVNIYQAVREILEEFNLEECKHTIDFKLISRQRFRLILILHV